MRRAAETISPDVVKHYVDELEPDAPEVVSADKTKAASIPDTSAAVCLSEFLGAGIDGGSGNRREANAVLGLMHAVATDDRAELWKSSGMPMLDHPELCTPEGWLSVGLAPHEVMRVQRAAAPFISEGLQGEELKKAVFGML